MPHAIPAQTHSAFYPHQCRKNSVAFVISSKSKPTTVAEHFLSSSNHTPSDNWNSLFQQRRNWKGIGSSTYFFKPEESIASIFVKVYIKP